MALPAPDDATKWYHLAAGILEGIVAPGARSRKRRYQQLKSLYDLISDVYIDYARMFSDFDRSLPRKIDDSDDYIIGAEIIAASAVPKFVERAKSEFDAARRRLSTERLVWKNMAAGWFQAASDKREQYFLFSAFWFLEYRDDYVKSPLRNDEAMDRKISRALENGGSATFDTPSVAFALKISKESDPAELVHETKRMQLHINELFRFVVQNFRRLEDDWNPEIIPDSK
ncbi:MAG: hypothetical protein ACK4GM_06620 [Tabrizicola sp.]